MHPFGPDAQHRLIEALVAIREAIVDALLWFSDLCLEMFEWLAQGQVRLMCQILLGPHCAACEED